MIKLILIIIVILLLAVAGIRIAGEINYSFKMKKEINQNNATCYFDRGWFNLPLAKVCTYNDTLLIEREEVGKDG